jgi:hypothetical protein
MTLVFIILLVRLYASYADQKVFVQQIGTRPCGFNGFKTERGVKFIAQHGDCLEVLYGKHSYKIEFNPPPRRNLQSKKPIKRLLLEDSEDVESQSSKKFKTDIDVAYDMEESTSQSYYMPSTSISDDSMKVYNFTEGGKWEQFSDDTLFVYTSNSCKGRPKVRTFFLTSCLNFSCE